MTAGIGGGGPGGTAVVGKVLEVSTFGITPVPMPVDSGVVLCTAGTMLCTGCADQSRVT